jgi:hypothetical protein
MKLWISMLLLFLSVTGLCVWDGIHTTKTLNYMKEESGRIFNIISTCNINDISLSKDVENLNDYWTKKMDILSISISRKDMQPISDYLQYLCTAIINENQEDAITYSKLLNYNIIGLNETIGISFINLL